MIASVFRMIYFLSVLFIVILQIFVNTALDRYCIICLKLSCYIDTSQMYLKQDCSSMPIVRVFSFERSDQNYLQQPGKQGKGGHSRTFAIDWYLETSLLIRISDRQNSFAISIVVSFLEVRCYSKLIFVSTCRLYIRKGTAILNMLERF